MVMEVFYFWYICSRNGSGNNLWNWKRWWRFICGASGGTGYDPAGRSVSAPSGETWTLYSNNGGNGTHGGDHSMVEVVVPVATWIRIRNGGGGPLI